MATRFVKNIIKKITPPMGSSKTFYAFFFFPNIVKYYSFYWFSKFIKYFMNEIFVISMTCFKCFPDILCSYFFKFFNRFCKIGIFKEIFFWRYYIFPIIYLFITNGKILF